MKILIKKILLAVLLLGLLLPVFDAQAFSITGFLGDVAYDSAAKSFAFISYLVFSALATFLGILVQLMHWVVNIRIYTNIPIIESSWGIMRDFANMLFIIALIVMAYGTIFNIPGYDFRSLIKRFIVIAVLINFSLVLGGLIIDATQVLNNTFLVAMGDISGRLAEGLEPWSLFPDVANVSGDARAGAFADLFFSSFITILFGIFLAFAFLVSVAVPLVIAFVRIPILWALLIVSPMAWLLSILPATKGAYNAWWKQFLSWNLFLPYYLFFLYFALYFLSQKNAVIAGMGQQFAFQGFGNYGIQNSVTVGLLFYYILIAVFLIGGTKVAMSAGQFSGTGIINIARGTRAQALSFVRRRTGYEAASRAAKMKAEEIQKEGLPGRFGMLYGGERALERQTAKWAERFGIVGATEVQMAKEIGETKKKFERITDPAQLRGMMNSGRITEQLATREIMKGRNLLDSQELLKTYELYGGNRSLAGKQFARSVDYDKLSDGERAEWLTATKSDVETQQKIYNAMAEKGDRWLVSSETNIKNALELLNLEGEQRDLLKKIEKHDIELATKIAVESGFIKDRERDENGEPVGELRDIREIYSNPAEALDKALRQTVSRMNPDALLEATRTLTRDERMRQVAREALNLQKIEAMMAKGTGQQLNSWRRVDNRFDEESIRAEKERAARKLAEVTGRAAGEAIARAGGLGGESGGPSGGGAPPQQPPPGAPPAAPGPRRPAGFVRPDETVQQGNVVDLRNRENQ